MPPLRIYSGGENFGRPRNLGNPKRGGAQISKHHWRSLCNKNLWIYKNGVPYTPEQPGITQQSHTTAHNAMVFTAAWPEGNPGVESNSVRGFRQLQQSVGGDGGLPQDLLVPQGPTVRREIKAVGPAGGGKRVGIVAQPHSGERHRIPSKKASVWVPCHFFISSRERKLTFRVPF